jgi:hypothetical protein
VDADEKVYLFAPWYGRKSRTLVGLRRSKRAGKCKSCGTPTLWRTLSEPWKVVHPPCAGLTPLDPEERQRELEAELDALVLLARELGGVVIKTPPVDTTSRPIEFRTGPCGWCGKPGLYMSYAWPTPADKYAHCPEHSWPPYRWPDERKSA